MLAKVDVIVVGLHLRWDGVWQRPNHLLARLAKHVDVIVVEEPRIGSTDVDVITDCVGVTVVQPQRMQPRDVADPATCDIVRTLVGDRQALIWLYTPLMLALADALADAPVVYDKMDELAGFQAADPRICTREPEVLRRATVAFAGGTTLYTSIVGRTANPRCYPSGVDVEHFRRVHGAHRAVTRYAHPRIGYVGVIDERLDLGLIDAVAAAHPEWTLVMVGPTAKIDPATCPRRENIAYLGKRSYDELPALLSAFDVGIMPFARNEATRSISPTKTLEYLASGLPVVSTPVADVVAQYQSILKIADGADAFIAAIEATLAAGRVISQAAELELAAQSWDAIVAQMIGDLEQAGVSLPQRRAEPVARRTGNDWARNQTTLPPYTMSLQQRNEHGDA